MDKGIEKSSGDERTSIVLPLNKQDLGHFIFSLLGQQQSIERDLEVTFDINHSWVINLHELLDQRINQQADATLTSFNFVIYFANGLRRTLTTVEALKNYAETKKDIPVGIKVLWIYLVQFPGRDHPEKQEISFSAQIHSKERISKGPATNKIHFESEILESIIGYSQRSTINYNIEHTERTWGDDLEVIISNQIDEIIRGNEVKDILFNLTRLVLAIAILIFSLVYPIYTISTVSENSSENMQVLMEQYNTIKNSSVSSIENLNMKIDHIATMISESTEKKGGVWPSFIFLLFGPSLALLILRFTREGTSSFLVFNKESESDRERKLKKENRRYIVIAVSYILAILGSIIANYGYAWLIS